MRRCPWTSLDSNVLCEDAIFADWPEVDAIVGNPPYQSKNKMQAEFGRAYVNRIRAAYPDIPGRADYCVYWFRRTHDYLKPGQRAGLVGTNTIRQNYSRTGGLDYIVANDGTITEAVSTMKWSGEAVVYVSIVNWIKGGEDSRKRLYIQEDDNDPSQGWRYKDLDRIGPSLSFDVDVTTAQTIQANAATGGCFQGQTHGHEGFLLTIDEAKFEKATDPRNAEVLFPYLIASELVGKKDSLPTRYVIDFGDRDLLSARGYYTLYKRIEETVLPTRQRAARDEEHRNAEAQRENARAKITRDHANALKRWWQLFRSRKEMIQSIESLSRYIVCGRVTRRPIFVFLDPGIHPNDALMVFPFEDDYSFGILQSSLHWEWFINRCSTLKGDPRYTSNTVFDSFPWPQSPRLSAIEKVAEASKGLRILRRKLREKHAISLRELYRSLELPGHHPLKDAQEALDEAVRNAYTMPKSKNPLEFLLELNEEVVAAETAGKPVLGPGLPALVKDRQKYVSKDCLSMN